MGCISATVSRLGGIGVSVSRTGGINASAHSVGGINVTVSLICSINDKAFIKVTPVETQWIDVDFSINYNIKSNTNWNIV